MTRYDYDPNDPASWQPFIPPVKDTAFERELLLIAGKTGDKPNLRLVWAGTELDDRTEHKMLKYHCGWTIPKTIGFNYIVDGETFFTDDIDTIPKHILGVTPVVHRQALGLPRWVIERYTSPKVLEQMRRFSNRRGENDFTVLREFPKEGIYESWQVIETKEGLYRDVGSDILAFIRHKWKLEQEPFEVQEALFQEWKQQQERQRQLANEEAWHIAMDETTKLPYDERMRREYLENKIREDEMREARDASSVSVYYSQV
jgi:hypothetical protein